MWEWLGGHGLGNWGSLGFDGEGRWDGGREGDVLVLVMVVVWCTEVV